MSKRLWALVAVAAIGGACDSPVAPVDPNVYQVVVAPATHTLVVGDSIHLNARAVTQTGLPVNATMSWSSEAETVAVVRAQGALAVVEARRPGTTRIVAEAGGRFGRTTITVVAQPAPEPNPTPVHDIDLTPPSGSLSPNEVMTIAGQPRAADGSPLAAPIQWFSTDTTVLVVTPGASDDVASVHARAEGSARVRAHSQGVDAFATVVVSGEQPPERPVAFVLVTPSQRNLWEDQSTTFQVRTLASNGLELSGRSVTLRAEDETVAVVEAGHVHALREGTTRIVAESEGVRGYATLYVYEQRQQMFFQLTYDWRDGIWRPQHQVGTAVWTDDGGVEWEIPVYAVSGVFTIDLDQMTWSRVISAEGYVRVDDQVHTVGRTTYTGGGQMSYHWTPSGSMSLTFVEAAEPGETYSGQLRAGEVLVGLPVLNGLTDYLFRIGG